MLLLEQKTVLVTGATGFLAKIFVEKILRIQPNVKKLYLLLRASTSSSAAKRFHDEVLGKEVFRVLKDEWGGGFQSFISEKVVAVSGDVSSEDLGIEDLHLKEEILKETDLVLNFAAITKFDERYDVALGTNTFGALHVLNFSKKCAKIKLLIQVSTAYVYGEERGILMEKPLILGKAARSGRTNMDVLSGEIELAQKRLHQLHSQNRTDEEIDTGMKNLGLERAGYYGWPNTYTFTKAMAEMVMVESKGDLPLVIIRPTMVTSTLRDPFPGWLEGVRTLDGFIVSYARGRLKCIVHRPDVILDLIPADIVVDATIGITAMALANQHVDLVYHLGSSSKNPIRLPEIHRLSKAFFAKDPWKNRQGKPVKAGKVTTFSSMASFHVYMAIRFQLPLKIMGLLSASCCHKLEADYVDLRRQLKSGMRLIQLYKSYLFFDGIFDDTNLEKLRKRARDQKGLYELDVVEQLNMDIRSINWEGYITNVHIPGLLQFVMKK
ncbi:unnamed protein product [Linum tenue]|uniref:Fatty acyl-CoA reductase n=1 Tax=Linum tenue TaxID=586396 RepID=A0AAV0RAB7_9ROSI|nr:unnamed protein product [Linum tenue]